MLISSQLIIQDIEKRFEQMVEDSGTEFNDGYKTGLKSVLFDIQRFVDAHPIDAPMIFVYHQEKTVTLYCNDDLYKLLSEVLEKKEDFSNFNIMTLGKYYSQIKKIFDKEVQKR